MSDLFVSLLSLVWSHLIAQGNWSNGQCFTGPCFLEVFDLSRLELLTYVDYHTIWCLISFCYILYQLTPLSPLSCRSICVDGSLRSFEFSFVRKIRNNKNTHGSCAKYAYTEDKSSTHMIFACLRQTHRKVDSLVERSFLPWTEDVMDHINRFTCQPHLQWSSQIVITTRHHWANTSLCLKPHLASCNNFPLPHTTAALQNLLYRHI